MEGSRAVSGRRYHRSTPPSPHIHTLLLVSPNPNPILSPNSFVRTFSTQSSGEPIILYFQIFIRFWSNPCITFFLIFFSVNTFLNIHFKLAVLMLFTIAPFFVGNSEIYEGAKQCEWELISSAWNCLCPHSYNLRILRTNITVVITIILVIVTINLIILNIVTIL